MANSIVINSREYTESKLMNYDHILQSIQNKLGVPPRKFTLWDKLSWYKQDKPDWDWWNEDLKHSVENWEKVFTHGHLTWGRIIQVNTLMFQHSNDNNDNCPGEVLIWLEKEKSFDAEAFDLIGTKLYELKGYSEHLDESDEKGFAEHLENEVTRVYGIQVPQRIAQGLNVRVSTIFFQRRHIPKKVIRNLLFPFLYLDQDPMVVVMVPSKFWPRELLQEW